LRAYGGDLIELATARYWLEQFTTDKALDNARDPDEVRKVEQALRGMANSAESMSAWATEHSLFHSTIVGMAGNRYLTSIYESLHSALLSVNYHGWVEHDQVPYWLAGEN